MKVSGARAGLPMIQTRSTSTMFTQDHVSYVEESRGSKNGES